MKLAIMVHSHDGPRVFGDIPGCFFKYWFSCKDSIRENVVRNAQGCIMDRWIVVDFHGGSRGFECVAGFLLSVLLIGVISGLLMDLDRRRFYGNAWNY